MDEIDRLKRQIRILTIGVFVAVFLVIISLIQRSREANTRPDQVWPDLTVGKLKANEVYLMSSGGSPRLMLTIKDDRPSIVLLDSKDEIRMMSGVVSGGGAYIRIMGEKKGTSTTMTSGLFIMGDETKPNLTLSAPSSGGPSVSVRDDDGYSTVLGRADVINKLDGTHNLTSAASIVVSSTGKTVQWSPLKQSSHP